MLVPDTEIDGKLFHLEVLVRDELDGDLTLLYQLLLFHWFLTVDLADFLRYALTDAELLWGELEVL